MVLACIALASLLEAVVPLFPRSAENRRHLGANLAFMGTTFAINLAVTGATVAAAAWSAGAGFGLLQRLGIVGTPATLAAVVLLDLTTYLVHRSMHVIPALWRVHLVHHTDPAVDATTAFRQHPVESVYRFGVLTVAATLIGASPWAIALYRALSAVNAVFEHANLRISERWDSAAAAVWVTPNMHKMHHSRRQPETDSNYGNLTSLFDRLLGTFTPTSRAYTVHYGIDGHDSPESQTFRSLIALPLRRGAGTDSLPAVPAATEIRH